MVHSKDSSGAREKKPEQTNFQIPEGDADARRKEIEQIEKSIALLQAHRTAIESGAEFFGKASH